MADERQGPDHTDDPRGQRTGQGGYPEAAQEGTAPAESTDERPEAGTGGADAPRTSSDEEDDRDASTGNRDAAG